MLKVAIIMGSTSDYDVMSGAEQILSDFGIEFEKRVISAHRTPELMFEYTKGLKGRGFGVVIAGAVAPPIWPVSPQGLRHCRS